ncbi:MAG: peroxidase [Candidatus Thiothrix singaporensis]|uniref:Peroxidase n=1 Tax=Candidatus Thiothrix singaporensis TaxID=2799669 RepID=A0A7L6ARV5_9GAMM|nr:MAG: peroxidase [Candidatus Thiothrix singaporensis]
MRTLNNLRALAQGSRHGQASSNGNVCRNPSQHNASPHFPQNGHGSDSLNQGSIEDLLNLVQQLLGQLEGHGNCGNSGNNNNNHSNRHGNGSWNCDPGNSHNPGASTRPNLAEYRSVDGSGNNLNNTSLGSANQAEIRLTPVDASREPGGTTFSNLPSPRAVSNAVSAQEGNTANSKGLSDMFWVWGQFLDHDLSLVPTASGNSANIAVPTGDPYFDPNGTGSATIGFTRSSTEVDASGQSQQINSITSYIDGSNVYGSDATTADNLRSHEGGKLLMLDGELMPENASGQYMAGDSRANENPALTSMHTLWVREHNRITDELAQQHPQWSDEQLYQEARKINVAQMQAITYNEFLPALLGENALPDYQGYNPAVHPTISNEFAAAIYRLGHTLLSPNLLRLDENGATIPEGNLALRAAFFNPQAVSEAGIEPILRGAASQTAQAVDTMVVDDVRNFLFGQPGDGGFDLVALNIQRGRDHGLPGYNDAREAMGLPRIESFDDPIWRDGTGVKLAQVYASPDDVDLWVGGLAEKETGDSLVGELSSAILVDQFTRLRDGDRFWYENAFSGKQLQALNNLKLSDVIKRNTDIQNIQDEVMVASNVHLGGQAQTTAPAPQTSATHDNNASGSFPEGNTKRRGSQNNSLPTFLQQNHHVNFKPAFHKGRLG